MPKGVYARRPAPKRPLRERFLQNVQQGDGCWLWLAGKHPRGYGQIHHDGRLLKAHRLAWEFANGPIPAGLAVCHRCDNPSCVRLDHLFLGTAKDNHADMYAKGRHKHVLTSLDVYLICLAAKTLPFTQMRLARTWGVSRSHVANLIVRDRKAT